MAMKPGHKVNKSDPTYLKNKEKREQRKARKNAGTPLSNSTPALDPILNKSDDFLPDPLEEARLSNPDSFHINKEGKEGQAIFKKWNLSVVPYFLIVVIMFHLKRYLEKHNNTLFRSLNQYIFYVNKSNVGAVRLLVFLYSQVHTELLDDVDLQFYVNQAQRHNRKLYSVNHLLPDPAFLDGITHHPQTNADILYNGKLIPSFQLFDQISTFFSKSENFELFGQVYVEFVGQNRINNCYSAIKPNYVWALDISTFSFPNCTFMLFVAMDLASRRIMHYDFFTDKKEATSEAVFASLVKAFKKHNVEPEILHTDQASYFFGYFESQLRADFQHIRLSKTRLNLTKSKNQSHQNQAVEAFFSSFKKWLIKKHGNEFFSSSYSLQQAINLIRDGLKEVNATKEHRVLSSTPDKDYFNKTFLEIIRSSISTQDSNSLSNSQIDNIVKSREVLDAEVVSDEIANDLSLDKNKSDVVFISEDGVIYDQNAMSANSAVSPLSSSPKVQKLLKSDIQVSSSSIAEQLNHPDMINEVIKIAIKQLPNNFFEDKFLGENDIIFNDHVYNAFFYSIKETLLNGPGASSPLADYLQDKLPNLIRGPGKISQFHPNYLKFLDIQFNLNAIIQVVLSLFNRFILRLQFLVISRQSEASNALQIAEHQKTQSMIKDNHNKTLNEFQTVKEQLALVTAELNERKEKEQAALEAKERRKHQKRLPPRDAITEEEFLRLNEFCNNMTLADSSFEIKYKASFLKIAFFLLQASGMRASNLFEIQLRDLEQLISNKNNPIVQIPLIKSSERKFAHIAIDAYVRKHYILNEPYNVAGAFYIIKQHAQSWLSLKNRKEEDCLNFPLAATYKNPDKTMSREYLTKSLNNCLKAINTDKFNKPLTTRPKTTHGFRIAVVSKITGRYGIDVARDFVQHADIQTTDKYVRSRLTDQRRRQITSILFNSARKDSKSEFSASLPDSVESNSSQHDEDSSEID